MTKEEIQAQCKEERTFLHDVATPVGTVTFLVDAVLEMLRTRSELEAAEIEQLELSQKALEQLADLIRSRRSTLISRSERAES